MMKHIQNQLNLAQQKIQDLIEQKEALEKELNNVKEELGVVNKRSVENQDTVGVVKVLLEEIKQRDNDILDYTEYSKKQHAELLVVVNVRKSQNRKTKLLLKLQKGSSEDSLKRPKRTTKTDSGESWCSRPKTISYSRTSTASRTTSARSSKK